MSASCSLLEFTGPDRRVTGVRTLIASVVLQMLESPLHCRQEMCSCAAQQDENLFCCASAV